jgi:SsrA-binding protein
VIAAAKRGNNMAGAGENIKIIAQNRKAYHEYFIDDKIECGIVLAGTEVKSLRKGAVNFRDSYAEIRNGECFLCGMHISPYEQGNIFNKDPLRDRKLLLHKSEINRLLGFVKQKGLTLVPLELYFSKGKVKLLLGVARGKKLYDKRDSIAAKDTAREIDRRLKESFRE